MAFPQFNKDPDSVMDYKIDWTSWLVSDTVAASTWTLPAALTEHGNTTFDNTSTTLWVSGGVVGSIYECINHITTAAGRQEDQTIKLQVRDK